MYERYFGLRERAFDLTPNPRFLLLLPAHREALANVRYGVTLSQGLTLLTGEAGTGKTSVVRTAMAMQALDAPRCTYVHVTNPTLRRSEFLELLAEGFAIDAEARASKSRLLRELERKLRQKREQGVAAALVIDEAQSLPDPLFEEVRLLANIESDTHKLLPVVLTGQPELAARLNEWRLRHVKQRVALRCALLPLTIEESAIYIAGRLRLAGGDPGRLFTRAAVIAVHHHARGIPRTINVLCENALLTAFARRQRTVDVLVIEQVARDFDLQAQGARAAGAAHAPAPANDVRPFPTGAASGPDAWHTGVRLAGTPGGGR